MRLGSVVLEGVLVGEAMEVDVVGGDGAVAVEFAEDFVVCDAGLEKLRPGVVVGFAVAAEDAVHVLDDVVILAC